LFAAQIQQQNDDDEEVEPDVHPQYFILDPTGTYHPSDIDIGVEIRCDDLRINNEYVNQSISSEQLEGLINSLSSDQRAVYKMICAHCDDLCNQIYSKPLHIFTTGGVGVGKSHLIKTIRHTVQVKLRNYLQAPEDTVVLVSAPCHHLYVTRYDEPCHI